MFNRRESFVRGRARRLRHRSSKGTTTMIAASDPIPTRQLLSGPAAAVLVALAGAALVAIGLLLVGVREAKVSLWTPGAASLAQDG
jgi:hypothetical protein